MCVPAYRVFQKTWIGGAVAADPALFARDGCMNLDVLLVDRVTLLTDLRDALGFGDRIAGAVGLALGGHVFSQGYIYA